MAHPVAVCGNNADDEEKAAHTGGCVGGSWFCSKDIEESDIAMPDYEKQFDVFLSYSRDDAEIVEELASRLADEWSFVIWLDKWEIAAGDEWQQEMARGINQSKAFAACIGSQSPDGWFDQEIKYAIDCSVENRTLRVIPVLLPGGNKENVHDFLKGRHWVEFEDTLDDKRKLDILASGIEGKPPGRKRVKPRKQPISKHEALLEKINQLENARMVREDEASDTRRDILKDLVASVLGS